MRVIIDAGHGGQQPCGRSTAFGARGPGGTLEKDVTLQLARRVAAHLGSIASLTRTGDVNLSLADRIGLAREESYDLPEEAAKGSGGVVKDVGERLGALGKGIGGALGGLGSALTWLPAALIAGLGIGPSIPVSQESPTTSMLNSRPWRRSPTRRSTVTARAACPS